MAKKKSSTKKEQNIEITDTMLLKALDADSFILVFKHKEGHHGCIFGGDQKIHEGLTKLELAKLELLKQELSIK